VNERHMTDRQPDPPGDAKRPRPAVNLTGPSRTAQHPQRVRRITFPAVPLRLRCRGKCGEMTSQQSLIHAKRRRPGGWTAPFAPHRSRHKALARVWRSRHSLKSRVPAPAGHHGRREAAPPFGGAATVQSRVGRRPVPGGGGEPGRRPFRSVQAYGPVWSGVREPSMTLQAVGDGYAKRPRRSRTTALSRCEVAVQQPTT